MRLAIIIPTTNGPVRVVRITRLARAPLSQVIKADDFVPNAAMTTRYHALIDQGGPLRELIALSGERYELCLDRLPEMGRSWELPVALAHWAFDRGHELVTSDPEIVVWATGVVKPSREIADEDYHLEQKLESSRALLQECGTGERLLALLPASTPEIQVAAFRANSGPAIVVTVAIVDAAVAALEAAIDAPRSSAPRVAKRPAPEQKLRRKHTKQTKLAAIAGLVVAVGIGLLLMAPGVEPGQSLLPAGVSPEPATVLSPAPVVPAPEPTAEPASDIAAQPDIHPASSKQQSKPLGLGDEAMSSLLLVEHRAPSDASCIDVLFGTATETRVKKQAVMGTFPASDLAGLCAISFESGEGAAGAQLDLPIEFLSRVIFSDRIASVVVDGSAPHVFHLLDGAAPLTYESTLTKSSGVKMTLNISLVEP